MSTRHAIVPALLAATSIAGACGAPTPTPTEAPAPAPVPATPAPSCEDAARNAVWQRFGEPYGEKLRLVWKTCELAGWSEEIRACAARADGALGPPCDAVVGPVLEDFLREPELVLDYAAHRLRAAVAAGRPLPAGSFGPVPAGSCCAHPMGKCPAGDGRFGEPWDDLGILPEFGGYFRYSLEGDGEQVRLRAVGDRDCDDVEVEFVLTARRRGGDLEVTLARPERPD